VAAAVVLRAARNAAVAVVPVAGADPSAIVVPELL
jgi:hypothetical protein